MKLFVDTSAWVALFDRSDKYHFPATSAFRLKQGHSAQLLTTDYVLDETLTHLRYACGHQVAVNCGKWLLESPHIEIVRIDQFYWEDGWRIFRQFKDKAWAFTDCVSFCVMWQLELREAFTFDHHFAQAGFVLWPENLIE